MKILGVIASAREDSLSAAAIRVSIESMRQHGAEVDLLDLRCTPLPLFSPHEKHSAPNYTHIKTLVESADAYTLATPDYHGSMSGVLKNFLDYFWTEFAGKTFAYICASHEKGLTAMDQIRTAVRQCYGWSLPYGVSIAEPDVNERNEIINETVKKRLSMLGRDLAIYGGLLHDQRMKDLQSSQPETFLARYRKS